MIKDLLLPFLSGRTGELAEQASKLTDALHELGESLESLPNESTRLLAIRHKMDRFPTEALDEIEGLVGRRFVDRTQQVRRQIQESLELAHETLDHLENEAPSNVSAAEKANEVGEARSAEAAIKGLNQAARKLNELVADVRRSHRKYSFAVSGVYVLMPVLAYLASVATRLPHGLEKITNKIISPARGYESTEQDGAIRFELSDAFVDQFLEDFSQYYFKHSKELPPTLHLLEDGQFQAVVAWEALSQNRARNDPLLISDVDVDVTFVEARPFPWDRLPVTPDLSVETLGGNVTIKDQGIGPAVDVRWRGETKSGLVLVEGQRQMMWRCSHEISLLTTTSSSDFDGISLNASEDTKSILASNIGFNQADGEQELLRSCFLKIDQPPASQQSNDVAEVPAPSGQPFSGLHTTRLTPSRFDGDFVEVPSDARYFEYKNQWYERVDSLARLRELTDASQGGQLTLAVHYNSLHGNSAASQTHTVDLPAGDIYFRRTERLLESDPRPDVGEATHHLETFGGGAARNTFNLILGAALPSLFDYSAPGEDKVQVPVIFNSLIKLAAGATKSERKSVSEFINPRGLFVLGVQLNEVQTGTYRIVIRIDKEVATTLTIDTLVPDHQRFDPYDTEHLRK